MPELDDPFSAPISAADASLTELPPAPTPPAPTLRRLFFGDDGLRAGWSFALFILFVIAFSFLSNFALKHLHPLPKPVKGAPSQMTPDLVISSDGLIFFVCALSALCMSLIERRPFARYGLSLRRALPDFLLGLFWGFVALSALVGVLFLTHSIAFDGLELHGATALSYGAKYALAFLLVGFAEEFFTRGYIQYTVSRGVSGITRAMDPYNRYSHQIGFWVAAAIFSIGFFMLAHLGNAGENFAGILAVGLAGAVFAFSLYRTGTLWWAIGSHASWDWAQSYFYGTSDSGTPAVGHLLGSHPLGRTLLSGGPDGPEGSLFVIPTLLLLLLIIHYTLPRRIYPLTPDQSPLTPVVPQDLSRPL